jgi:hypothetical protein
LVENNEDQFWGMSRKWRKKSWKSGFVQNFGGFRGFRARSKQRPRGQIDWLKKGVFYKQRG